MTKRAKKKIWKVMCWIAINVFSCFKELVVQLKAMAARVNNWTKRFSAISVLLAASFAVLLSSLAFGPFKVAELFAACWISEAMWIWFRGEE